MFSFLIQLIKDIFSYPRKVGESIEDFVDELKEAIDNSKKYNGYTNEMFEHLREREEQFEDKRRRENETAVLADQLMPAQQKKDHLRSEYWRLLKLNKLVHQGNYCGKCGKLSKQLDLHHLHYRTLGYETLDDVILLCSGPNGCHQKQHDHHGYDRKTNYSKVV